MFLIIVKVVLFLTKIHKSAVFTVPKTIKLLTKWLKIFKYNQTIE